MYLLIQRESGGCDYTIGCGIKIDILGEVSTMDDAIEECYSKLQVDRIESAEILEVSDSLNVQFLIDKKILDNKTANENSIRENELEEFKRLKKKLGL